MIEFNQREQELGEEGGGGLSVAVVGIGGAGANVLDRIALEGMTEAELVCMNTDIRALTNSVAATKVQLGKNLTQGLGAGGDPDLGEDAAKSSEDDIRSAVKGKDIVFVCGGLGGGTGSGAAPFISGVARSEGAFVVAFTTMPFSFEGRRRLSQAQNSLNHLRKTANALITFDNDRMGSLVLPKQGIQEAFAEADKIISQSVRAVIQLVTKPGLISIGMDDLITALDNDDSRCLFGFGQATGENRAQEALSKALKSPLLDKGQMLEEAQNVLVHVCGGDSMTLFEVELLMKSLEKEVSDKAQILFGVGSDPKLGDKLSVTVISSMGKQLPPTADDHAPKGARSESGDEQKNDSAPAESANPEVPKSSRSEVKPDSDTSSKAGAPVAVAAATATGLGASLLSTAKAASRTDPAVVPVAPPPRARMSPIRRAVLPVDFSPDAVEEKSQDNPSVSEKAGEPPIFEKPGSTPGKGMISIFEDDDEDDSSDVFDDADEDLDDDLDLMGDLGLDDEELDRLVAESAAVGLDDGDDDLLDGNSSLPLIEDADLVSDGEIEGVVVVEDVVESREVPAPVVEEPISAPEIVPPVVEPKVEDDIDFEEEEVEVEVEVEEEVDAFEEDVDVFDDDDLDELTVATVATVAAGAAVPDVQLVGVPVAKVAKVSKDTDDFLLDVADDDDFESFDDADELEVDEVAEDLMEEEFVVDEENDDPFFGEDSAPAPAPRPADGKPAQAPVVQPIAASVAPAQANKADELLKRVGLRRAGSAGLPARAPAAAERPQAGPQQAGGKTRFAWSRPGTVPAPVTPAAAEPETPGEARETLPAAKLPLPRASGPSAAAPPDPQEVSPAAESPFTPKGFVKKKQPAAAVSERRALPAKPTPLRLNPVAPPAVPVEDIAEPEPEGYIAPEQQNFDSTLEPRHQKGRFEKGEPTVEDGEDLDLPTFLRRKKG
jgi:cell division protein FtsZ